MSDFLSNGLARFLGPFLLILRLLSKRLGGGLMSQQPLRFFPGECASQEGASQEQNIYGTCTEEEQRELSEAGIDILPLPELPPEH